jgi:uncharacterized protein (TIGR00304 family)
MVGTRLRRVVEGKIDYSRIARTEVMAPARLLKLAALLTIIIGIVISVASIALGQMRVMLFIIFPVFYAEGLLPAVGIALLFIGIIALFLSFFVSMTAGATRAQAETRSSDEVEVEEWQKPEVKGGGVVLIGPVPIIIGSDWRMAITAAILAILLIGMVLLFLL